MASTSQTQPTTSPSDDGMSIADKRTVIQEQLDYWDVLSVFEADEELTDADVAGLYPVYSGERVNLEDLEELSLYAMYLAGSYYHSVYNDITYNQVDRWDELEDDEKEVIKERTLNAAIRIYKMAAERGSRNAMYWLGFLYAQKGEVEEMNKYYIMAIDKGDADAKEALTSYYKGNPEKLVEILCQNQDLKAELKETKERVAELEEQWATHVRYQPGGPGMEEAAAHFESLQS